MVDAEKAPSICCTELEWSDDEAPGGKSTLVLSRSAEDIDLEAELFGDSDLDPAEDELVPEFGSITKEGSFIITTS